LHNQPHGDRSSIEWQSRVLHGQLFAPERVSWRSVLALLTSQGMSWNHSGASWRLAGPWPRVLTGAVAESGPLSIDLLLMRTASWFSMTRCGVTPAEDTLRIPMFAPSPTSKPQHAESDYPVPTEYVGRGERVSANDKRQNSAISGCVTIQCKCRRGSSRGRAFPPGVQTYTTVVQRSDIAVWFA